MLQGRQKEGSMPAMISWRKQLVRHRHQLGVEISVETCCATDVFKVYWLNNVCVLEKRSSSATSLGLRESHGVEKKKDFL